MPDNHLADQVHSRRSTPFPKGVIAKGVRKTYRIANQEVEALKGVDLQIAPGSIVAITGKSGAGKSTLMHILGTLDRPTSGQVILNGTDVSNMSDLEASRFRNHSVGFVFQMSSLLHEFSAVENVMLPGLISGAKREPVFDRASGLLKAVGLGHRLNHRPGELSGGEQQRVAIARALIMAPPILLADEPTGNLDYKTSLSIQELLMEICRENKVTMLLVTHDMDLAKRMPTQVVIEDGKVDGKIDQYARGSLATPGTDGNPSATETERQRDSEVNRSNLNP